ncbi:MAG: alpha-1,3-galactosidase B [Porphyromonadaceae bacterium]|nr:alpha-1,3-galactosidase B [Porphyromonadaceae bacterium]
MRHNLLATLGCILALLGSIGGLSAAERVIHLVDFGVRPQAGYSNTEPLNRALAELTRTTAPSDTLTLILSPGVYEFTKAGAPVETLYISNHDHEPNRSIGIHIKGLSNVRLEGMGAELLFLDRMLPIAVVDSRNIELRNLRIDFRHPQISHVRVEENRGKAGLVLAPICNPQWRLTDEGELEFYGPDWSNRPYVSMAFDGSTKRILYRTADIGLSTKGSRLLAEGRIWAPKFQDERLKAGSVLALRTYDRPNPGIFLSDNTDIHLENINIHYADGMGLLAQNTHNVSLDGFNVCLRGDSDPRYATTQADATHFSGCSGHIDVRRSLFEGMMDDAINVHGVYLKLIKRVDNHTIEGQYMHHQAWGMDWGKAGDSVQFVASSTFEVVGDNTLTAIEPVDTPTLAGAKILRLRFAKKLPRAINPSNSIGIENLRKTPSVTFAGNTIRHNRARGTLLNTPKPIKLEYNVFDHISGSAILVSSDCNQWFESGQTKSLHIRGNLFLDVLTSVFQFTEAAISLFPVIPQLDKQRQPFYGDGKQGITIEDNVFMTFDTPLLFAQSVDGILWRRNRVVETKSYPKFHWNQQPFILKGSRGFVQE